MADKLSIAIGTVLSALEIAETKGDHVKDTRLVYLQETPTNIVEFSLNGTTFEVLINEKSHRRSTKTASPMHKVSTKPASPKSTTPAKSLGKRKAAGTR